MAIKVWSHKLVDIYLHKEFGLLHPLFKQCGNIWDISVRFRHQSLHISCEKFPSVVLSKLTWIFSSMHIIWLTSCLKLQIVGSNPEEQQKMFGRHFEIEDELVSKVSRRSIDILKANFRVCKNSFMVNQPYHTGNFEPCSPLFGLIFRFTWCVCETLQNDLSVEDWRLVVKLKTLFKIQWDFLPSFASSYSLGFLWNCIWVQQFIGAITSDFVGTHNHKGWRYLAY